MFLGPFCIVGKRCFGRFRSRLEDRLFGLGGEKLEGFNPHDGVALRVEARTPYGYGVEHRIDSDNAPSDATLARQTDKVGKFAGFVVETAGLHDGIHALHLRGGQSDACVVEWTTVVGKSEERFRQLVAAHFDRAH